MSKTQKQFWYQYTEIGQEFIENNQCSERCTTSRTLNNIVRVQIENQRKSLTGNESIRSGGFQELFGKSLAILNI